MFKCQHALVSKLLTTLTLACLARLAVAGAEAGSLTAPARLVQPINEAELAPLPGGTHALAIAKNDQGPVADSLRLEHVFIQLQRSPEQEKALEDLIAQMHDPNSANHHQWLTAEELGRNFGPAQQDIDTVVQWLNSHGVQVNGVSKSGLTIDVSLSARQVRELFRTEIHKYAANGQQHIANASNPQIPAALSPVVAGIVGLHDFLPKPMLKPRPTFSFPCIGCPDGFDNTEQYYEAPADFHVIYNSLPLYRSGIKGQGRRVVVLEISDINPADVATFRSAFGLSKYSGTFAITHPGIGCDDPGTNGAEGEAALDAEWAGAIAPDAHVELASCANSVTNFGGFIAAQSLMDSAHPPHIMSLSYISCEGNLGPGGNAYVNALWQQAASEGISVFVPSGDAGAAGCDDFTTAPFAELGIAANGLASTPYNVSTGATDFLDTFEGTNSIYWSKTDRPTGKSARSYVPEMPWNDSCASLFVELFFGDTKGPVEFCNTATGQQLLNIDGGGGGPSRVYPKPYWQKDVVGMPINGRRNLPDVSLFASNGFWSHAILFCMSDATEGGAPCDYSNPTDAFSNSAGGSSFTAPQFASIQALINQKAGGPQGNPNPVFYDLARKQWGTASNPNRSVLSDCNATNGHAICPDCIFHDITAGDIAVPCIGTNNCYDPSVNEIGVLSTSNAKLQPAYKAHTGWDFATGLGSVNVTNLVNNWP